MRNHKQITSLVWLMAVVVGAVLANENPTVNNNNNKQLDPADGSKVKIIDNSRVLSPQEVDRMSQAEKQSIPVVVPLIKGPHRVIEPKLIDNGGLVANKVDEKQPQQPKPDPNLAVDPPAPEASVDEKLPPMPLFMPSFVHNLFDPPPVVETLSNSNSDADSSSADSSMPKHILSVLLVKSHRIDESNTGAAATGSDSSDASKPSSSSFIILRYLPKSIGSMFGLNDETSTTNDQPSKLLGGGDDDVDKKRAHLFGGDDDVDKKRAHLFGGDDDVDKKRVHLLGGDDDPDRLIRISLGENNKGVFTGGNEDVYSSDPLNKHKLFVFSMFDRVRSMFDQMRSSIEDKFQARPILSVDSSNPDDTVVVNNLINSLPFISSDVASSSSDDSAESLLSSDDIERQQQQQQAEQQTANKCMMLQFMRLKASMYYRTVLHLLFFAGVLLFVPSLLMWTWRACRRRQYARRHHRHHHHHHHPHPHPHMAVASIDAKSKLAAYKAWQGMDQSSLIEPSSSDKIVLIQAPPAYDQVFIHDKNSTLTSSSSSSSSRPTYATVAVSDECETRSLPPEYDEGEKQPVVDKN